MDQERCVLDYLATSGVGVLVPSLSALPADLPARCAKAKLAVGHVSNRAVFEVAEFLEASLARSSAPKRASSDELV